MILQVLSALDILQPPQIDCFEEMYPISYCPTFSSLIVPFTPSFYSLNLAFCLNPAQRPAEYLNLPVDVTLVLCVALLTRSLMQRVDVDRWRSLLSMCELLKFLDS